MVGHFGESVKLNLHPTDRKNTEKNFIVEKSFYAFTWRFA
jgi:hypothetical protein